MIRVTRLRLNDISASVLLKKCLKDSGQSLLARRFASEAKMATSHQLLLQRLRIVLKATVVYQRQTLSI